MKCQNCGQENRAGVKFCEECGNPMKTYQFCPQCGHENRAGVNFCEECGTPLKSAPVAPPAPAVPPAQPAAPHYAQAPQKRRPWIWALGGGLLAVLLCCFSYVLLPAPPVSGDTTLPDFLDNTWGDVVRGREYNKDQGGLLGAVITGVEAIIPNPVEDAVAGVVGGVVGGGEKQNKPPVIEGGVDPNDLVTITSCSDLIKDPDKNDQKSNQEYNLACNARGGVVDSIKVGNFWSDYCLCPTDNAVSNDCEFFDFDLLDKTDYKLECQTRVNKCEFILTPAELLKDIQPEVLIRMKNGMTTSAIEIEGFTNGCSTSLKNNDYRCEVPYEEEIDPDQIKDFLLCHEGCCVNLKEFDDQGFFGLTDGGGCPDANSFEVNNFRLNYGVITLDLVQEGGWEQSSLSGVVNDALDRRWSGMDCRRDNSDRTVMSCTSTDSGITIRTGKASFIFEDGVFGASCDASLDLEFPLPPWAPPSPKGCSPGYHSCPQGWCCPDGWSCSPSGCG